MFSPEISLRAMYTNTYYQRENHVHLPRRKCICTVDFWADKKIWYCRRNNRTWTFRRDRCCICPISSLNLTCHFRCFLTSSRKRQRWQYYNNVSTMKIKDFKSARKHIRACKPNNTVPRNSASSSVSWFAISNPSPDTVVWCWTRKSCDISDGNADALGFQCRRW